MKRVCAYCRVSTEHDDQLNSLENQKRYFEQYISGNLDWQFCGLYVDEGLSGTSVERREGFKRMVVDAENKKFDLLLTKEISRFARNTLDSIFYTRKLKGLGVGVVFMNDNINTLDADAELRLTIMSSIAQEESRKTSQRVRWGQKQSMKRGVVFGACPLGYNLKNGKLTINEDDAKIVRLIFDLYVSGMGTTVLRKELENRGILSPSGSSRWKHTVVLDILKNEKYIGVLKQKKTLTTDFLSHKRKVNRGEEEYIIVENSHPSLVEKEVFDSAQKELARRRATSLEKGRYSNRYVWSGKIKCARCNSSFKRRINNSKSKNPQVVWHCGEFERYGRAKINAQGQKRGCDCQSIHESVLKENFLAVLNAVIENKDLVVQTLNEAVRQVIARSPDNADEMREITASIGRINSRQSKLVDTYVDGLLTRAEFEEAKTRYSKQLDALSGRLLVLKQGDATIEELRQRLAEAETAIENLARLKEFGDSVCGEVLAKVVVAGREKMAFYLAPGENKDPVFFKIPLSVPQS